MTRININYSTLLLLLFIASCADTKQNEAVEAALTDTESLNIDSLQFPLLIDNGKKVVYQFTKMTPRGPRVFLDTVDYNPRQAALDSLNAKFLFPLQLSEEERNTSPGIIGVSIPGVWEEAIFGLIDERDRLKINYRNTEYLLPSTRNVTPTAGSLKAIFEDGPIQIILTSKLSETATGTHLSGKGKMQMLENDRITQESDVFIVLVKK